MIFVTLGSQKFQFNRLLIKIDELVEDGTITDEVFAQIGYSDYRPKNYKFQDFLSREEFGRIMDTSAEIITHGGTGAIVGAVKQSKKVIAVPRLAKYGEHVDDHQLQIVKQLSEIGNIISCNNIDELSDKYTELQKLVVVPYVSNTQNIIEELDSIICEIIE